MDGGLAPDGFNAPTLDSYKRLFTEARDLAQTARERARKHRRYYDGKIDAKLQRELRRKRQPDFTINRVRPGVEGMVGVAERAKVDPRAYPRTPQDEGSAEVATDSLRYVADQNRWHQLKMGGFRNMLIEGVAAALIEVDDQLEVKIRRIRFEEFFADPYSRELDYSDAGYMGIAKWQPVDAVVALYPDFEAELRLAVSFGNTGDSTWDDRPSDGAVMWADTKRKRLLLVEMYHRHAGQWLKCVFVGDLKLEEGVSPYEDQDGKPCNPIEAQAAYIDDENNRYGVVADMIGPQDEINTYRRKAAHFATFRQVQESDTVAAYADPEEVRREAAKPDGVIPSGYNVVPNDKFSMDMALLAEAKAEIERGSPNPALLGRQGENQSGRAALVRQQAGLTELAHLFAGLEDWELRVYRQCWARIRQFWNEPKFIRVTDDENAIRFVQINKPIWGPPAPVMDPLTGMPKFDPITRQVVMQPQFLGMENAVAQMGVDIIIDSTPDTANVAQEQFQALVDLARAGVQIPPAALIKASSLPKKREIVEAIEQAQQQQPDPRAEAAAELAMREKAAGIDKTSAQAEQARANALRTVSEARNAEIQARMMTAPPVITGF
jgi:hypothetical protein